MERHLVLSDVTQPYILQATVPFDHYMVVKNEFQSRSISDA